jgi:hypothetical protein
MELDEMKTVWKELDDRLGRQEMSGTAFIKESVTARSQRSVNRFLNYELTGVVVLLVAIPLAVWKYSTLSGGSFEGMKLFVLAFMVLLPLILVWQLIKIRPLFKINMSKGLKDNVLYIQRYELYAMYEKRIGFVFIPLMFIIVTVYSATIVSAAWWWAAWVGVLIICVLFTIWYYKKFYAGNMAEIKRGFAELKDM